MRILQSYFHRLENEFGAAAQKAILARSRENSPKLFSSAGKTSLGQPLRRPFVLFVGWK